MWARVEGSLEQAGAFIFGKAQCVQVVNLGGYGRRLLVGGPGLQVHGSDSEL